MKKILFYGTGEVAKYYLEHYSFGAEEKVVGFVQTRNKGFFSWRGVQYSIYLVEEIAHLEFDEIWITNIYIETLMMCLKNGVSKEKLCICTKNVHDQYCSLYARLDIRYQKDEAERLCEYDVSRNANVVTLTPDIKQTVYYTETLIMPDGKVLLKNADYFRYATFQLLADEIKKKKIKGAVAELGVFQGKFARCINSEFPDRDFWMFDTFEGFPDNDISVDIQNGYTSQKRLDVGKFAETSVDFVMSLMPYSAKCIVRKGCFPDTIPKEDIQYAFVSIDCDLYKPMLEGLRYFYPRLSSGGYMMIHDYTHDDHFIGVKKAVEEFENEAERMIKVPISDKGGTLVIGK